MVKNLLDQPKEYKKIDKNNLLSSIIDLPKQCTHAWSDAIKITLPNDYLNTKSLIMCGMGGSGLGARMIESLFYDSLKIPLYRVNDYLLPNFTNSNSLVVCSSYSGNTEEVLENFEVAKSRGAKVVVIGSGGILIDMAKENNYPYYKINPKFNTSNQPRMAIGYSVVGQLAISKNAGLIDIKDNDIDLVSSEMRSVIEDSNPDIKTKYNEAKKLALKLSGNIIIIVSSQHLVGSSHVLNNQFNENSKTLSFDFQVPELNHHLMEGLKFPKNNYKNIIFLFINSNNYDSKIKKRLDITKDVVNKNKIEYCEINLNTESKLNDAFKLIQIGSFVNYYLSILNKQDPTPIPWVDYFKEKLNK